MKRSVLKSCSFLWRWDEMTGIIWAREASRGSYNVCRYYRTGSFNTYGQSWLLFNAETCGCSGSDLRIYSIQQLLKHDVAFNDWVNQHRQTHELPLEIPAQLISVCLYCEGTSSNARGPELKFAPRDLVLDDRTNHWATNTSSLGTRSNHCFMCNCSLRSNGFLTSDKNLGKAVKTFCSSVVRRDHQQ